MPTAPAKTPNPQSKTRLTDTGLILACGGSGQRFGPDRNKLLLDWRGAAVFCHPLRTFLALLPPEHAVVVAPAPLLDAFRAAMDAAGIPRGVRLVAGGATRQDSVANGLAALPCGVRIVAVQDGARPCTTAELFLACAESAREHGSGIAARPVTDTIKVADAQGNVKNTPDRATLWAAETPQTFRRERLEDGLHFVRQNAIAVTDDAQAVELAGHATRLVRAAAPNPKVTFPADLDRMPPPQTAGKLL